MGTVYQTDFLGRQPPPRMRRTHLVENTRAQTCKYSFASNGPARTSSSSERATSPPLTTPTTAIDIMPQPSGSIVGVTLPLSQRSWLHLPRPFCQPPALIVISPIMISPGGRFPRPHERAKFLVVRRKGDREISAKDLAEPPTAYYQVSRLPGRVPCSPSTPAHMVTYFTRAGLRHVE